MSKTLKRYEEFQKAVFEGALEAAKVDLSGCCRFHQEGGTYQLCCGGDSPNEGGKHSQDCSYFAGGDCTCGHSPSDWAD